MERKLNSSQAFLDPKRLGELFRNTPPNLTNKASCIPVQTSLALLLSLINASRVSSMKTLMDFLYVIADSALS